MGMVANHGLAKLPRVQTAHLFSILWFAKTPADREINNIAWCHLTTVLL
jgi:hypothetical protein